MADIPNRLIPSERISLLLAAIEDEMGRHGLRLILRQAGLSEDIETLSKGGSPIAWRAQEHSRLLHAVRIYFGLGARGSLIRIGRRSFRGYLDRHRLFVVTHRALLAAMPQRMRLPSSLRWLANRMAGGYTDLVTVVGDSGGIWFVDKTHDRTLGIRTEASACWTAVGEIAEASQWATGAEVDVQEIECRLTGSPHCRFRIQAP